MKKDIINRAACLLISMCVGTCFASGAENLGVPSVEANSGLSVVDYPAVHNLIPNTSSTSHFIRLSEDGLMPEDVYEDLRDNFITGLHIADSADGESRKKATLKLTLSSGDDLKKPWYLTKSSDTKFGFALMEYNYINWIEILCKLENFVRLSLRRCYEILNVSSGMGLKGLCDMLKSVSKRVQVSKEDFALLHNIFMEISYCTQYSRVVQGFIRRGEGDGTVKQCDIDQVNSIKIFDFITGEKRSISDIVASWKGGERGEQVMDLMFYVEKCLRIGNYLHERDMNENRPLDPIIENIRSAPYRSDYLDNLKAVCRRAQARILPGSKFTFKTLDLGSFEEAIKLLSDLRYYKSGGSDFQPLRSALEEYLECLLIYTQQILCLDERCLNLDETCDLFKFLQGKIPSGEKHPGWKQCQLQNLQFRYKRLETVIDDIEVSLMCLNALVNFEVNGAKVVSEASSELLLDVSYEDGSIDRYLGALDEFKEVISHSLEVQKKIKEKKKAKKAKKVRDEEIEEDDLDSSKEQIVSPGQPQGMEISEPIASPSGSRDGSTQSLASQRKLTKEKKAKRKRNNITEVGGLDEPKAKIRNLGPVTETESTEPISSPSVSHDGSTQSLASQRKLTKGKKAKRKRNNTPEVGALNEPKVESSSLSRFQDILPTELRMSLTGFYDGFTHKSRRISSANKKLLEECDEAWEDFTDGQDLRTFITDYYDEQKLELKYSEIGNFLTKYTIYCQEVLSQVFGQNLDIKNLQGLMKFLYELQIKHCHSLNVDLSKCEQLYDLFHDMIIRFKYIRAMVLEFTHSWYFKDSLTLRKSDDFRKKSLDLDNAAAALDLDFDLINYIMVSAERSAAIMRFNLCPEETVDIIHGISQYDGDYLDCVLAASRKACENFSAGKDLESFRNSLKGCDSVQLLGKYARLQEVFESYLFYCQRLLGLEWCTGLEGLCDVINRLSNENFARIEEDSDLSKCMNLLDILADLSTELPYLNELACQLRAGGCIVPVEKTSGLLYNRSGMRPLSVAEIETKVGEACKCLAKLISQILNPSDPDADDCIEESEIEKWRNVVIRNGKRPDAFAAWISECSDPDPERRSKTRPGLEKLVKEYREYSTISQFIDGIMLRCQCILGQNSEYSVWANGFLVLIEYLSENRLLGVVDYQRMRRVLDDFLTNFAYIEKVNDIVALSFNSPTGIPQNVQGVKRSFKAIIDHVDRFLEIHNNRGDKSGYAGEDEYFEDE